MKTLVGVFKTRNGEMVKWYVPKFKSCFLFGKLKWLKPKVDENSNIGQARPFRLQIANTEHAIFVLFFLFFCLFVFLQNKRFAVGHMWMFNHNTKSPESWSHSWFGKKTKHKSEHNQERGAIALKVLCNLQRAIGICWVKRTTFFKLTYRIKWYKEMAVNYRKKAKQFIG